MKYRILGRTGLKVSELGFGGHEYRRPLPTTLCRWGEIDLEEFMRKQLQRNELIKEAIGLGINYFDTTQPEEAKSLGFALKDVGAREDVHVALMILRPLSRMAEKSKDNWRQIIIKDVEEKLDLLQSNYTDILNVHMPEICYSRERLIALINVLEELKQNGKIRSIAASSHQPRFLAEVIRTHDCFDSVMVRYNYHMQEAKKVLFPLCKVLEIGVVVMKPLAWPYYGIPFMRFGPVEGEEGQYTPAQTSLRWILNSPEVSTVVPGMNNLAELQENLKTIEKDELIDERILIRYLEVSHSPTARKQLEKMLKDSAVDLRHFAKRAQKDF